MELARLANKHIAKPAAFTIADCESEVRRIQLGYGSGLSLPAMESNALRQFARTDGPTSFQVCVNASDCMFTVILDFVAAALPTVDHRLELAMRTNGNGFFAASTPRHTKLTLALDKFSNQRVIAN